MLKTVSSLFSAASQFDLSSRASVIAAVSGGSDSTALLMLLEQHLREEKAATRLIAVTVDHGLRESSADEAAAVARLCAAQGIEHRIMRWTDPKPASGIPAAARAARYRLLAQAAREVGTDIVLTGHTANDQAETVAMRQARGDGPGLAGMAFCTLYEGDVWLVRPLLGDRRELLRDYLGWRRVSWAEDTTNADERFERPRVRARLAIPRLPPRSKVNPYPGDPIWEDIFSGSGSRERSRSPDETARFLGLASSAGRARQRLASRAGAVIAGLAGRAAPGLLHLDPLFARCPDQDAAVYALRALLATAGGCEHLPPEDRVRTLMAQLAGPPFRGTLSRTLIAARSDGIWLARETRGLPAPQLVTDGMIWDGRYRLHLEEEFGELQIAPLGPERAGLIDAPDAGLPASLFRAAAAGRPVFSKSAQGSELVADSWPEGMSVMRAAGPYARFMPGFDFELAAAITELIGAPALPLPPFTANRQA